MDPPGKVDQKSMCPRDATLTSGGTCSFGGYVWLRPLESATTTRLADTAANLGSDGWLQMSCTDHRDRRPLSPVVGMLALNALYRSGFNHKGIDITFPLPISTSRHRPEVDLRWAHRVLYRAPLACPASVQPRIGGCPKELERRRGTSLVSSPERSWKIVPPYLR